MNIFSKFKEEKRYISIMKRYAFLKQDAFNIETETIKEICDYIIEMSKTKSYKDKLLKKFREEDIYCFEKMSEMSIMIQALDKQDYLLARADYSGEDRYYLYSPDTFNFDNETIDRYIREMHGLSNTYYFCLELVPLSRKELIGKAFTRVPVTREDIEYLESYTYADRYYLEKRFEDAIRAVYQCYLEIKDEIKEIMLYHIEQDTIDLEYD